MTEPTPSDAAVAALAPNGVLRAGINLSNFLLVTHREEDGTPVGVSPDMAAALASNLGVGLDLVTFPHPGLLADAATEDRWDIGNIGADPARAEHIDFSSPYAQIEATYLVRADSDVESIGDVDRPGITISCKARAAYALWLERNIEHATLLQTDTIDESIEAFADGRADVVGCLRPRLLDELDRQADVRLLDGRFMRVLQAMGTPAGRDPAGIDHLEAFVVHAVESGMVASSIERHGVNERLGVATR